MVALKQNLIQNSMLFLSHKSAFMQQLNTMNNNVNFSFTQDGLVITLESFTGTVVIKNSDSDSKKPTDFDVEKGNELAKKVAKLAIPETSDDESKKSVNLLEESDSDATDVDAEDAEEEEEQDDVDAEEEEEQDDVDAEEEQDDMDAAPKSVVCGNRFRFGFGLNINMLRLFCRLQQGFRLLA